MSNPVLESSWSLGEITDFPQCPSCTFSTLRFCAPFFLKNPHLKLSIKTAS
ncbi:MAG: hypothetical protein LBS83_03850 [Holosporales bacterium]|nr:hypothetical protein [Holosporales bacterium]